MDAAYAGETSGHAILPAFADTCSRYSIPARYFHDLISGAEMDLTEPSYATFDRLREYCYRVAGTVGLTCIHVFGFRDPRAPDVAERLGIAFQLTNILRDLRADYEMGRVYLPQEDLERFGVREAELAGPVSARIVELMEFEAERAWRFYEEGAEIVGLVERDSRGALFALARTYSSLLAAIETRGFDVFSSRVRLKTSEKFGILVRAQLGAWSEAMSSKSVIVIGGGLAGLSAAVALAEAGYRITLLEKRPFLGGRATSYVLPSGDHVDNCQHLTLGCCTNLDDFYKRAGAGGKMFL